MTEARRPGRLRRASALAACLAAGLAAAPAPAQEAAPAAADAAAAPERTVPADEPLPVPAAGEVIRVEVGPGATIDLTAMGDLPVTVTLDGDDLRLDFGDAGGDLFLVGFFPAAEGADPPTVTLGDAVIPTDDLILLATLGIRPCAAAPAGGEGDPCAPVEPAAGGPGAGVD